MSWGYRSVLEFLFRIQEALCKPPTLVYERESEIRLWRDNIQSPNLEANIYKINI